MAFAASRPNRAAAEGDDGCLEVEGEASSSSPLPPSSRQVSSAPGQEGAAADPGVEKPSLRGEAREGGGSCPLLRFPSDVSSGGGTDSSPAPLAPLLEKLKTEPEASLSSEPAPPWFASAECEVASPSPPADAPPKTWRVSLQRSPNTRRRLPPSFPDSPSQPAFSESAAFPVAATESLQRDGGGDRQRRRATSRLRGFGEDGGSSGECSSSVCASDLVSAAREVLSGGDEARPSFARWGSSEEATLEKQEAAGRALVEEASTVSLFPDNQKAETPNPATKASEKKRQPPRCPRKTQRPTASFLAVAVDALSEASSFSENHSVAATQREDCSSCLPDASVSEEAALFVEASSFVEANPPPPSLDDASFASATAEVAGGAAFGFSNSFPKRSSDSPVRGNAAPAERGASSLEKKKEEVLLDSGVAAESLGGLGWIVEGARAAADEAVAAVSAIARDWRLPQLQRRLAMEVQTRIRRVKPALEQVPSPFALLPGVLEALADASKVLQPTLEVRQRRSSHQLVGAEEGDVDLCLPSADWRVSCERWAFASALLETASLCCGFVDLDAPSDSIAARAALLASPLLFAFDGGPLLTLRAARLLEQIFERAKRCLKPNDDAARKRGAGGALEGRSWWWRAPVEALEDLVVKASDASCLPLVAPSPLRSALLGLWGQFRECRPPERILLEVALAWAASAQTVSGVFFLCFRRRLWEAFVPLPEKESEGLVCVSSQPPWDEPRIAALRVDSETSAPLETQVEVAVAVVFSSFKIPGFCFQRCQVAPLLESAPPGVLVEGLERLTFAKECVGLSVSATTRGLSAECLLRELTAFVGLPVCRLTQGQMLCLFTRLWLGALRSLLAVAGDSWTLKERNFNCAVKGFLPLLQAVVAVMALCEARKKTPSSPEDASVPSALFSSLAVGAVCAAGGLEVCVCVVWLFLRLLRRDFPWPPSVLARLQRALGRLRLFFERCFEALQRRTRGVFAVEATTPGDLQREAARLLRELLDVLPKRRFPSSRNPQRRRGDAGAESERPSAQTSLPPPLASAESFSKKGEATERRGRLRAGEAERGLEDLRKERRRQVVATKTQKQTAALPGVWTAQPHARGGLGGPDSWRRCTCFDIPKGSSRPFGWATKAPLRGGGSAFEELEAVWAGVDFQPVLHHRIAAALRLRRSSCVARRQTSASLAPLEAQRKLNAANGQEQTGLRSQASSSARGKDVAFGRPCQKQDLRALAASPAPPRKTGAAATTPPTALIHRQRSALSWESAGSGLPPLHQSPSALRVATPKLPLSQEEGTSVLPREQTAQLQRSPIPQGIPGFIGQDAGRSRLPSCRSSLFFPDAGDGFQRSASSAGTTAFPGAASAATRGVSFAETLPNAESVFGGDAPDASSALWQSAAFASGWVEGGSRSRRACLNFQQRSREASAASRAWPWNPGTGSAESLPRVDVQSSLSVQAQVSDSSLQLPASRASPFQPQPALAPARPQPFAQRLFPEEEWFSRQALEEPRRWTEGGFSGEEGPSFSVLPREAALLRGRSLASAREEAFSFASPFYPLEDGAFAGPSSSHVESGVPLAVAAAQQESPALSLGPPLESGGRLTEISLERSRPRGLRNLGNSCYLNSLLQALFLCDCFVSNLFRFSIKEPNAGEGDKPLSGSGKESFVSRELLVALQFLCVELALSRKQVLDASAVLQCLPCIYQQQQQQDVSEAAHALFEMLGGHDQMLLRLTFAGWTLQRVECSVCLRQSQRVEVVSGFSFSLPTEATFKQSSSAARRGVTQEETPTPRTHGDLLGLSVQTMFQEFVCREILSGDNQYACETCGKKRDATKWQEIASPPAHLVVTLNRYGWDAVSNERSKLPTHVHANEHLSVCGFQYELYAAIIHAGKTANSGHYYCIGRRSETSRGSHRRRWFCFDDSAVTEVEEDSINLISMDSSKDDVPYMLFYRCIQAPRAPPCLVPSRLYRQVKVASTE